MYGVSKIFPVTRWKGHPGVEISQVWKTHPGVATPGSKFLRFKKLTPGLPGTEVARGRIFL
jgi:hypothetical protein